MDFLRGKNISLRPVARQDLPLLRQWGNDPELRGLTGSVIPKGEPDDEKFIQKVYD